MERILVPLDGSETGETALPSVLDLVSKITPKSKVQITLFQAISSPMHYVVAGEASAQVPYTEKELELIKKKTNEYLKKVGERFKGEGLAVKTRVTIGNAADEILKTAEETKADLIAMSTHGRSGISRWAFGSVTDKVLRAGITPVLVVRAQKNTEQV